MRTGLRTAFLFGLMMIFLTGCPNGGGSNKPTVQVVVPSAAGSVASGNPFTVTIDVKNVGQTFYAAFDVIYDETVIQFVDATEGGFLNRDGADGTFFDASLENGQPGRLAVGMTRVGPAGTVSGSGTLLTLTFKGITPGTSAIGFSDPKALRNDANADVEVKSWVDGEITVD